MKTKTVHTGNASMPWQLEEDLWSAADNLRANSDLKSSEYATPFSGLIFHQK